MRALIVQLRHLLIELGKLLPEPLRLERESLGRFLAVDRIELAQIARHAVLQLSPAPRHLRTRGDARLPIRSVICRPITAWWRSWRRSGMTRSMVYRRL
jgi:hypothetical protein